MTELTYYDTTILALGALFLGIIMLVKGGNWAIDAAVFIANKYGISPMVVGFTIIAFGTSLPELVVSTVANLKGSPGIALGNVLGSNIANILLVLGATAVFATLKTQINRALFRDVGFMILATILLAALLNYGEVTRPVGICMVVVLLIYVLVQFMTTKEEDYVGEEVDDAEFKSTPFAYATLFVGLMCIAVGAEFLVKGANVSAMLIGVPEDIIALSIIALGTSLPELSTSIIAARKKQTDMVIGNIVGSNVFNIMMIIGFASSIAPITQGSFAPQLAVFDVWLTLAVGIVFSALLFIRGKIDRMTGIFFFLSYIIYNIYIYSVNI